MLQIVTEDIEVVLLNLVTILFPKKLNLLRSLMVIV